jgi:hypothetical protein
MVGVISFSGSIIDSMLGTVQVKYMNPITQTLTEKKLPPMPIIVGLNTLEIMA